MTAITIRYIDHDGVETECRCFNEHHAMMLELSLAAEGLDHCRIRPRSRQDAPMDRFPGKSVRLESRGFPRPSQPLSGRALEVFNDVHARNGIWEAYDQGRIAHAQDVPRNSNPWSQPPSNTHANCGEWYRGWDFEDYRSAEG